jgi:hypothetical protein
MQARDQWQPARRRVNHLREIHQAQVFHPNIHWITLLKPDSCGF